MEENHSNELKDELSKHANRMQDPATAAMVWKRLLSESERKRLGTLEAQYANSKTIGIWQRAKNVSRDLAVVQLAMAFGLPAGDAAWMLKELGEQVAREFQSPPGHPYWDVERGLLQLDGEVIRRIQRLRQATHIVAILNAFQQQGWPNRIKDPLPGISDSERLGQALRRLREGLSKITFTRDGTGEGIAWRRLESSQT